VGLDPIRAFGDLAIYVALGLFAVSCTGFVLLGRRDFELARLFLTGVFMMVVVAVVVAVVT
jgi:hypothetical protein